tara:strand:+ start:2013 stop:2807 length:795 start_codon:yes stop_codon:yes gene_type:complete
MGDKNIITYTNDELIINNIGDYVCDCCGNKLTLPYLKYKCGCDEYNLFNYSCVFDKFQFSIHSDYNFKCIKPNCTNTIHIDGIYNYFIETDELIYIINKCFDEFIWLYESRTINKYWIYSLNDSKTIEKKYLLSVNNIHNNINCEYYKLCLLSLYNVSDNILNNVYSYLNLCKKCLEKKIYTNVMCVCNNNKKCNKQSCDSKCKILNKIFIELSNKKMSIDFDNNKQQVEDNYYFRNIKRVSKQELIDDINKIQGICSLKRKFD